MSRYQHQRSQAERLLRALRESPTGISPLDWLDEPAPDGGHRVTRVAARIGDLRRAGHEIVTVRRGRATLYRLAAVVPVRLQPDPPERVCGRPMEAEALFAGSVGGPPPLSPYDPEAA
jgi:Helix-turn-helix domain